MPIPAVSRAASPPSRGAVQRSPANVKTTDVPLMDGWRRSRGFALSANPGRIKSTAPPSAAANLFRIDIIGLHGMDFNGYITQAGSRVNQSGMSGPQTRIPGNKKDRDDLLSPSPSRAFHLCGPSGPPHLRPLRTFSPHLRAPSKLSREGPSQGRSGRPGLSLAYSDNINLSRAPALVKRMGGINSGRPSALHAVPAIGAELFLGQADGRRPGRRGAGT